MKTGKTLQELAAELTRQKDAKNDFIVDTRSLRLIPDEAHVHLDMQGTKDGQIHIRRTSIADTAHRQIGVHTDIPTKYYERMRSSYPELLAANVNAWFARNPANRMVRTLDGNTRAFLSDRYRRIDNDAIAEAVLPIISKIPDARIESCELTDIKMYIKVVSPRLEDEISKGDIVQAGIMITNSEVGHGAVNVQPLIYRLVCTNGMVINDAGQRRYHVGRQNSGENFELYRDDTLQADDRAFLMKVRDTVTAAVDETQFRKHVQKMRDAKEATVTTTDIPSVIELAGSKFGIQKGEQDSVLMHLIQGGDLSLYGLSNAVTRAAQDVDSYDRSTDLERIGWDVLNMSRKDWHDINTARD